MPTTQLALRNNGNAAPPAVTRHKSNTTRARGSRALTRLSKWQRTFLRVLRQTPSVRDACKAAQVDRSTAYRHRANNQVFAEKWREAIEASIDDLEKAAFARARDGDANLITFLLRCHRPEIYRERSEVAVAGGVIFIPQKQAGNE